MKIRLTSLVALALAGAFLVGCGDDDDAPPGDAGPGVDSGPPPDGGPVTAVCPDTAPAPDNQTGACCSRASNASRLDAPELRLAALRLTAPEGTLTGALLRGVLNTSFDGERFNWLIQVSGAPTSGSGPATIRTGYGKRAADGTFAFTMGEAPAATGDVNRWNPITVTGALDGETLSSPAYNGAGPLTIPVFDETDPDLLVVELPVFGLALVSAPLSESRTCIGVRGTSSYDTRGGGRLRAFIRVEDARTRMVTVGPVNAPLCAIIAGSLTEAGYCDAPQSGWAAQPNALCGATGCEANPAGSTSVCDPTTSGTATSCNAWELLGEFAAQGVEISN